MTRPFRIEYPGAIYYITSRGNARLPVFSPHPHHGILGSKEFIEKLKSALRVKSKIKEIPREHRLAFRPSLEEQAPPDQVAKKEERDSHTPGTALWNYRQNN